MKIFYKLLILFFVGLLANKTNAQDIHFSQFLYAPLTLNPANAGQMQFDKRLSLNYRNQWRSVSSPFKTFAFSYDMPLFPKGWKNNNLGIGVSVFNDRAGDSQMGVTQFNIAIADHVWLDKFNMLSAAVQGGFGQRSIDVSQVTWGNQYDGTGYDPNIASGENYAGSSDVYADFGAGLKWNYSNNKGSGLSSHDLFKARFGISYYHFNKPKQSFYGFQTEPLLPKLCLHGGFVLGTKKKEISFLPDFFYWRQGPSQQLVFGGLIRYALVSKDRRYAYSDNAALLIGMFWRNKDAFIFSTQLEYDHYAIGVSYDINSSSLSAASRYRGAMEISLRYTGLNPFNNKRQAIFKANSI